MKSKSYCSTCTNLNIKTGLQTSWLSWLPHYVHPGWERFLLCRVRARRRWTGRRHGLPGCRGEEDHRGRRQPWQVRQSRGARSHRMCRPQRSQPAHPGGFGRDDRRRGRLRSGVRGESSCHGGCGTTTHSSFTSIWEYVFNRWYCFS